MVETGFLSLSVTLCSFSLCLPYWLFIHKVATEYCHVVGILQGSAGQQEKSEYAYILSGDKYWANYQVINQKKSPHNRNALVTMTMRVEDYR